MTSPFVPGAIVKQLREDGSTVERRVAEIFDWGDFNLEGDRDIVLWTATSNYVPATGETLWTAHRSGDKWAKPRIFPVAEPSAPKS